MVPPSLSATDSLKKRRDELSSKRNALFKNYSNDPRDLAQALEIKTIDDEIAELTAQMREETVAGRKRKPEVDREDPSQN